MTDNTKDEVTEVQIDATMDAIGYSRDDAMVRWVVKKVLIHRLTSQPAQSDPVAIVAGKRLTIKPGAPEIALLCRAIFRSTFADDEDEAVVNAKYGEWPEDQAKAIRAAKFVLRALGGDGAVVRALSAQQGQGEPLSAADAWDELVNVDDRTSPEEYPNMCLITREELAGFMARAQTPTAPQPDRESEAIAILREMMDYGGARGTYDAGRYLKAKQRAEALLTHPTTDREGDRLLAEAGNALSDIGRAVDGDLMDRIDAHLSQSIEVENKGNYPFPTSRGNLGC